MSPLSSAPATPSRLSALPRRIVISGASGLIGTELTRQLEAAGAEVVRLVRRPPSAPNEVNWAPEGGMLDWRVMDDIDAVVNLAGAPVSRMPWTAGYRKQLITSRVAATRTLVDAMAQSRKAPKVLISGSAYGFYGHRPGIRLTEEAEAGEGFLAELAQKWEATAQLAPRGTRVVTARTGLVLGSTGVLQLLRTASRCGLGSHFGQGGQYWPWISVQDEARAITHLLRSQLCGPVNLVGPTPATQRTVLRAIAEESRGTVWLKTPERILKALLGEAAQDMLLSSQKIIPARLLADGFVFRHRTVQEAIRAQEALRVERRAFTDTARTPELQL